MTLTISTYLKQVGRDSLWLKSFYNQFILVVYLTMSAAMYGIVLLVLAAPVIHTSLSDLVPFGIVGGIVVVVVWAIGITIWHDTGVQVSHNRFLFLTFNTKVGLTRVEGCFAIATVSEYALNSASSLPTSAFKIAKAHGLDMVIRMWVKSIDSKTSGYLTVLSPSRMELLCEFQEHPVPASVLRKGIGAFIEVVEVGEINDELIVAAIGGNDYVVNQAKSLNWFGDK